MKALDLAYYINKKAQENLFPMSSKRLQKLLYYIQGYFLKEYRIPAFEDELEHWKDRPGVQNVYYKWRYESKFFSQEREVKIPKTMERIVENVIFQSSKLSDIELIEKTHEEDPWRNYNSYNEIIPKDSILMFFDKKDPLNLEKISKPLLSHEEKKEVYLELLEKRSELYSKLAKV